MSTFTSHPDQQPLGWGVALAGEPPAARISQVAARSPSRIPFPSGTGHRAQPQRRPSATTRTDNGRSSASISHWLTVPTTTKTTAGWRRSHGRPSPGAGKKREKPLARRQGKREGCSTANGKGRRQCARRRHSRRRYLARGNVPLCGRVVLAAAPRWPPLEMPPAPGEQDEDGERAEGIASAARPLCRCLCLCLRLCQSQCQC